MKQQKKKKKDKKGKKLKKEESTVVVATAGQEKKAPSLPKVADAKPDLSAILNVVKKMKEEEEARRLQDELIMKAFLEAEAERGIQWITKEIKTNQYSFAVKSRSCSCCKIGIRTSGTNW